MALAFAGGKIVYGTISGATAASLIADLTNQLLLCGWTDLMAVLGGNRLTAVSPQGLGIYLYIRDKGHQFSLSYNTTVTLNFLTIDGSIAGQDQELEIGFDYQAITGMCQLFVSQPGNPGSAGGSNFAGGIPYFPGPVDCSGTLSGIAVTRGFWSMGDFGSAGAPVRNALIVTGSQDNCEVLSNSIYRGGGSITASLRFPAFTIGSYIFQGFNYPSEMLWYKNPDATQGDFFAYEPLMVWDGYIQAQAWDSLIFSKKAAADTIIHQWGDDWFNWTHNYQFGGLRLRLPAGTASVNNHSAIAT